MSITSVLCLKSRCYYHPVLESLKTPVAMAPVVVLVDGSAKRDDWGMAAVLANPEFGGMARVAVVSDPHTSCAEAEAFSLSMGLDLAFEQMGCDKRREIVVVIDRTAVISNLAAELGARGAKRAVDPNYRAAVIHVLDELVASVDFCCAPGSSLPLKVQIVGRQKARATGLIGEDQMAHAWAPHRRIEAHRRECKQSGNFDGFVKRRAAWTSAASSIEVVEWRASDMIVLSVRPSSSS